MLIALSLLICLKNLQTCFLLIVVLILFLITQKCDYFLLADMVSRDIRSVPENLKQNHVIVEYRLLTPYIFHIIVIRIF